MKSNLKTFLRIIAFKVTNEYPKWYGIVIGLLVWFNLFLMGYILIYKT